MKEEKKTKHIPTLQLMSSIRAQWPCQKICKTPRNMIKYKIKKLTFNTLKLNNILLLPY